MCLLSQGNESGPIRATRIKRGHAVHLEDDILKIQDIAMFYNLAKEPTYRATRGNACGGRIWLSEPFRYQANNLLSTVPEYAWIKCLLFSTIFLLPFSSLPLDGHKDHSMETKLMTAAACVSGQ